RRRTAGRRGRAQRRPPRREALLRHLPGASRQEGPTKTIAPSLPNEARHASARWRAFLCTLDNRDHDRDCRWLSIHVIRVVSDHAIALRLPLVHPLDWGTKGLGVSRSALGLPRRRLPAPSSLPACATQKPDVERSISSPPPSNDRDRVNATCASSSPPLGKGDWVQ